MGKLCCLLTNLTIGHKEVMACTLGAFVVLVTRDFIDGKSFKLCPFHLVFLKRRRQKNKLEVL